MSTSIPTASSLKARPAGYTIAQHCDAIHQAMGGHMRAMEQIRDHAAIEGRNTKLLASEQRDFDNHEDEFRRLDILLRTIQNSPEGQYVDRSGLLQVNGPPSSIRNDGTGRVLGPDQRMSDWVQRSDSGSGTQLSSGVVWGGQPASFDQGSSDLNFGGMLRGWLTGRWDGAEAEQRVLQEGTQAGGQVLVPTPLSVEILDRARNASRCFQAGARTVPMDSQTLKVPRIAGSPNPAWRNENATIAEGDLTFDSVTFTAKSMALIVRASRELVEDGRDLDQVVRDDLAKQVALELDRVMLRGSGVSPEPRGVRNTSGVTVTAFGGVNGGAPTNYDHLLDAVQVVRSANYEPTGIIHSPRSATTLSKLKTTEGQYLSAPPELSAFPMYATNQVPTNITTGTSNDTSEIYVGDWSNLWFGLRTQLQLGTLVERYADVGQIAFLVWVRGDVQVVQPGAFNVITGVRP